MLRVDFLRGDAHMGVSQREKVGYVPIIMEHLPPAGWSDLATRRDLSEEGVLLRSEMVAMRSDLCGEIAKVRDVLRGEIAELRDELCGEMSTLRDELRGEISDLRKEMNEGFRSQLRWMIGTFLTLFIGSTTLISTFLLTVK